ncbi:hypothetical protein VCR12J2_620725 [Vibrio coralliirubri]|nr:hypothetical protein VCR12J2_620725 [Vibrio coralliirubri]
MMYKLNIEEEIEITCVDLFIFCIYLDDRSIISGTLPKMHNSDNFVTSGID